MARDQKLEVSKRKSLYRNYGYLIRLPIEELPEKHKSFNGGLRCFRRIHQRDEEGVKLIDLKKVRCKKTCANGSLYCDKHGGNNSRALTRGDRRNRSLQIYRKSYDHTLGDLLEAFVNDPNIVDLSSELGTLRLLMNNYINRLSNYHTDIKNPKALCKLVKKILKRDDFSDLDRFVYIKEVVDSYTSLSDGQSIDRINRLVDGIGRAVERMYKMQHKEDFYLTQEGLKVFLRGVIEVIRENVKDEAILNMIRSELLQVKLNTGGELKYNSNIIDVKSKNTESVGID